MTSTVDGRSLTINRQQRIRCTISFFVADIHTLENEPLPDDLAHVSFEINIKNQHNIVKLIPRNPFGMLLRC